MSRLTDLIEFFNSFFNQGLRGLLSVDFVPLTINPEIENLIGQQKEVIYLKRSWQDIIVNDPEIQTLRANFFQLQAYLPQQQEHISWISSDHYGITTNGISIKTRPIFDKDSNKLLCYELIGNYAQFNYTEINEHVIKNTAILTIKNNPNIYQLTLKNNVKQISPREHEILFLLCHGIQDKEIAYILSKFDQKNISSSTVRNTINRSLFSKLSVQNRVQLVNIARLYKYDVQVPVSFIRSCNFVTLQHITNNEISQ